MKGLQIGVIGSAGMEEYPYSKPVRAMFEIAEELGEQLAINGCIVVNGGKGGVMEAVCKGAKRKGGLTVAELAGLERNISNRYVDVEVISGDTAFRGPSQLVVMCDALIAIGGGAGTLQELAVAYRLQKPVVLIVGFGGWTDRLSKLDFLDERRLLRFVVVKTAKEAVEQVFNLLK